MSNLLSDEINSMLSQGREEKLQKFRERPDLFHSTASEMDININWDMITKRMEEAFWLSERDQKQLFKILT